MKRQEIINNLKQGLKKLDVKNGGFVKHFYEWVITPQEVTEYPLIVIRDGKDNIESDEVSGSSRHNLKIEIDLLVWDEKATTTFLREKLQEILNVIKELEEKTLIGDYVSFKGNEIEFNYEEFLVGLGKIEIEVTYWTEKWEI